jgi:hypothetical protein
MVELTPEEKKITIKSFDASILTFWPQLIKDARNNQSGINNVL